MDLSTKFAVKEEIILNIADNTSALQKSALNSAEMPTSRPLAAIEVNI